MTGEQHPDEGLGTIALGLGIAGLLPIPGVVAALAAIVCGRRALATDTSSSAARCGLWLGLLGLALPILFLTIYCVVLGYPFPIHRYRG